jgi:plastocyanin
VNQKGHVTHGHLPENGHYGGVRTVLPDPLSLSGGTAPADTVNITNFSYVPGDLTLGSGPPVIHRGQWLTFVNLDASRLIHHSVTACREPCNRETGVSYPIADGQGNFDSGQLGVGPPGLTAAVNRLTWSTPQNLQPGTYSYFCRIHPFMRGSFRVTP